LKLLTAEFVTSAAAGVESTGIPRDGVRHVAFAGRSNVGKSSLLNALFRRRLARTSAAPGKTRLANVYRVTLEGGPGGAGRWSAYFVDLPGYGFARGGAKGAEELRAASEAYFRALTEGAAPRAAVLLLVDSRHPGLDSDRAAARWLDQLGIPRHIVATKVDKLSRGERARNLKELERTFGTAALPVSAESGEGLDELWQTIAKLARR
jgi:GTP-binding protein